MASKKEKDLALVEYFRACKDECNDSTADIREIWDKTLQRYMCRRDWSKKQKWQSKAYTPLGKPTIKKAVRMIQKALIDAEDYFDFETYGITPEKKKLCDLTKRITKCHLNKTGFIAKFSEALESGFTLSLMILKMWVANTPRHWTIDVKTNELVTKTLPELKLKVINPYNFYFPNDQAYYIEDEWITVPQLLSLTESKEGPFSDKAVKNMISGDYTQGSLDGTDKERLERLGLLETTNPYRKQCLLSHFWGPVLDKKGNVISENRHYIVGNEKYILLEPEKNVFYHGKSPYIIGNPLPVLFRSIGKGLIEDVLGLEDAIVEFTNSQIDNLHWIMLGVNEVDKMAFTPKGQAQLTELYPGKLVEKRTGYQGDAFKHHELGTPPEKAMPLLQELKQFYQQDTSVTEYIQAMPSARAETLGQYEGKRGSAIEDFISIAKHIERTFLVECVDRARDLIIQYMKSYYR